MFIDWAGKCASLARRSAHEGVDEATRRVLENALERAERRARRSELRCHELERRESERRRGERYGVEEEDEWGDELQDDQEWPGEQAWRKRQAGMHSTRPWPENTTDERQEHGNNQERSLKASLILGGSIRRDGIHEHNPAGRPHDGAGTLRTRQPVGTTI